MDENGQTHFGDRVPNRYLSKEHKELNEQGATVKQYKAAETEGQRLEKLRLERIEKEKQQAIEVQARRDREILDTYTTERDLIAARDARLDAVGSQLQLSESIIKDAQRKLKRLKNRSHRSRYRGAKYPRISRKKWNVSNSSWKPTSGWLPDIWKKETKLTSSLMPISNASVN